MMDMVGDCASKGALCDANLCSWRPTAHLGIAESYLTSTDSMPSSSSTVEVEIPCASGCEPSGSNRVIERLMQARSEYGTALEFEIEASKVHWSRLDITTSDEEEEHSGSL
jgi:hypothetical protein